MKLRRVRELTDLTIDEVSLVDKGANQYATVSIAKRDVEEETMDEYYNEAGEPIDVSLLEEGDVVYDATGQGYEYTEEDLDAESEAIYEEETASVAKRSPFARPEVSSFASEVSKALSEAITDSDRDEVISKAFGQIEYLETVAKSAEAAAESERQLRLDREYTEVAKSYVVGVDPEELGPVLKRMAESLSYEDCEVIAKALDSASSAVEMFEEFGVPGLGHNSDVLSEVDAILESSVAKGDWTREEAVAKMFEENPQAYDEYLREQRGR